jgi:gliding motility-associated-like protein
MKDELIDQLQQRFTGHEVEVDPGLWNAISGKLAASTGDGLQEVLRDKFTGHEVPVDAHVWANISTQLGHGAAAGGGAAAWLAGGLAAAAVVGGLAWWLVTGEDPAPAGTKVTTEQVASVNVPEASNSTPVIEEGVSSAQPGPAIVRVDGPKPAETNTASVEGAARTDTDPSTERTPDPEGERTVQTVLGALVEHNAATPHFPDRPEPVHAVPQPVPSSTEAGHQAATGAQQANVVVPVKPTPVDANEPGTEELGEGDGTDDATDVGEAATQSAPPPPNILIPNVFSPQGDGINDRLKVVGDHYQRVSVRIISARTDAVVFKANNLEDQWNGRDMNNVPCEEGYYFYAIEITGLDGLTYSMGEVIKLFR